jgi:hypothetical protein
MGMWHIVAVLACVDELKLIGAENRVYTLFSPRGLKSSMEIAEGGVGPGNIVS